MLVAPRPRIRIVTNLDERVAIAGRLMTHVAHLNDSFFGKSIAQFIEDSSTYEFLVSEIEPFTEPSAFGILGRYTTPKDGGEILAVEAFWFEKEGLDDQVPIWEFIASRAKELGCNAVCLTERSTNSSRLLMDFLALGLVAHYPVHPEDLLVQKMGNLGPVYSALRESPVEQLAFATMCMMIDLRKFPGDLSGSVLATNDPLYRGEGRLELTPYWNCSNFDELNTWILQHGFSAGSSRSFSGTVPEQILHQGYVRRSTVSLTNSFEVAAFYATNGGKREHGLVFRVDPARVRCGGDIFDSYATMKKCCPWMLPVHFETLRRIVTLVGVREAGCLLSMCSDQAKAHVIMGERFFDTPKWSNHLPTSEACDKLARAGVPVEFLTDLHRALEGYWAYALQERDDVIGSIRREALDRVKKAGVGAFVYFEAFDQVYWALDYAVRRRGFSLGWDMNPLGYIAKTCRDQEFFSTGSVPGACIVEATLVNAQGSRLRSLVTR